MPVLNRICSSCGLLIDDPYYLMITNHSWHLSCLKCFDCGLLLEQEKKCFIKNGEIFCQNDYIKRYSSDICTRCNKMIQENEIILRAEQFIFHLKCFTCIICNILLHSGDEYGLKNNHIYCRDHFFEEESCNSHIILDDSGYHTSSNEICHLEKNNENFLIISSYYSENKSHHYKQKRLRTSFKNHQLRYMRSYFNLNHNPDAKELKNLSEKTNLSKRVLQVWFQNARAKYRRSNTLTREEKINNLNQLETCISPLEFPK